MSSHPVNLIGRSPVTGGPSSTTVVVVVVEVVVAGTVVLGTVLVTVVVGKVVSGTVVSGTVVDVVVVVGHLLCGPQPQASALLEMAPISSTMRASTTASLMIIVSFCC